MSLYIWKYFIPFRQYVIYMRKTPILIFLLFLSSCVSGPKYTPEGVMAGNGALYIYRERRAQGSAASPSVFINGEFVNFLVSGGYLRIELPEGIHEIEIGNKTKQNLIGWTPEAVTKHIDVQDGRNIYIKLSMNFEGLTSTVTMTGYGATVKGSAPARAVITEIPEEEAHHEIKEYKKIN